MVAEILAKPLKSLVLTEENGASSGRVWGHNHQTRSVLINNRAAKSDSTEFFALVR
jgi:hypothetical protein